MSKKYIKINLNQVVSRFQREEIRIERNRNYISLGLVLCFLALFSFNSYTNFKINKLTEDRETKIKNIEDQINLLISTKQFVDQVENTDITNLSKFEDTRTYWTPKIQALTNLTPVEMALTEIEFNSKILELTAVIKFEEGMDTEKWGVQLVQDMKNDPDINNNFINIRLADSYKGEIQGQKTFFYDIEAKIKKNKKVRKKKKST